MKKILILTTGSFVFGTEKVLIQLISGLKKEYQFHCLVNGWNDGQFIEKLRELGIPYTIHKLGWIFFSKIGWTIDTIIHYPYALYIFLKLIVTNKFDLYYTNSYRSIFLLYPFINKKVIYHVHELNFSSRTSCFFVKLINHKITTFIAVSECVADDLIKIGIDKSKIEVVYNGVDIIKNKNSKINSSKNIAIGIVGQIQPHKGHLVLLQAFKNLSEKYSNLKLFIIGDGDTVFVEQIKEIIDRANMSNNVVWKGYLINIDQIYSNIDVLCIPTINPEPFGLVACEAGMLSIPVVASNIGGLSEIVINGKTGLLFNTADSKDLENKLERLIESTELRNQLGCKARSHILNNFNTQLFLEKMNNLIQSHFEK